jgi:hypothetical protein
VIGALRVEGAELGATGEMRAGIGWGETGFVGSGEVPFAREWGML